jgi:hypothetical protein
MSCIADYSLVTYSQRRIVCADVCSARTSRRYQNRKFTVPSQFGILGAANWLRRLVNTKEYFRTFFMVGVRAHKRIFGAT